MEPKSPFRTQQAKDGERPWRTRGKGQIIHKDKRSLTTFHWILACMSLLLLMLILYAAIYVTGLAQPFMLLALGIVLIITIVAFFSGIGDSAKDDSSLR